MFMAKSNSEYEKGQKSVGESEPRTIQLEEFLNKQSTRLLIIVLN